MVLNHGGFYKQNVGHYKAPLRGIYVFLMTAVNQLTNTYVHMLHNEQVVSRASATYSTHNQSGSMMAILLLQQTDDIYTVLKSGHSLGGGGYSHWGGFLLATV